MQAEPWEPGQLVHTRKEQPVSVWPGVVGGAFKEMRSLGIGTILFIIIVGTLIYADMRVSYSCDIGEENITGDYKVIPDTFYNNRDCAINDCVAFNNWSKENGRGETCAV